MCALKYIPTPEQEGYYNYFKVIEDITFLLEKQRRKQQCGTLSQSLN